MKHTKIAIIGAGAVGVTTAYALMLKGVAAEIMLVDVDEQHTEGEVLDLNDALAFEKTSQVRKVDFKTAKEASIIVVAAGVAQKPGETRIDLLKRNHAIMKSIFSELGELSSDTIVLLASNPVDVMTRAVQDLCNLPHSQVIGSGTFLDSQRLREEISAQLNVAISSVHGYILGEHGDTQFPAWSLSVVGGVPVSELLDEATLHKMADKTKRKAYEIINRKGATYYGIGACLTRICEAIIYNKRWVLPLSVRDEQYDVCISRPVILGDKGVSDFNFRLNKSEQQAYEASCEALKSAFGELS